MWALMKGFVVGNSLYVYIALGVLALVVGAYGYYRITIHNYEEAQRGLNSKISVLEKEKAGMTVALLELQSANLQQSITIAKLQQEVDIGEQVRANVETARKKAETKYANVLQSSKNQPDTTISPRLRDILNNVNGLKREVQVEQ